jgi:hypothetical protein
MRGIVAGHGTQRDAVRHTIGSRSITMSLDLASRWDARPHSVLVRSFAVVACKLERVHPVRLGERQSLVGEWKRAQPETRAA